MIKNTSFFKEKLASTGKNVDLFMNILLILKSNNINLDKKIIKINKIKNYKHKTVRRIKLLLM